MIRAILFEYGPLWAFNRVLYSLKLNLLRKIPIIEPIFEKKACVKRFDILNINAEKVACFLGKITDEKKDEIIELAENAIKGTIKGFSSVDLDYGNPLNWHLNPITKVDVSKKLKWYSIPDFDPDRGDLKVIWEASRFTHFLSFARAYLITKEEKYYAAFSLQLDSWIKENKYSYGSNYKCGQEATLRMLNALITYSVFNKYGLGNDKDYINLCELVKGSYKKVLSNFFYAHKCVKNNHTLSEITGMIVGAWCCNDSRTLRRAYNLLDKEIDKQFLSDGGYIQYSFNYQRFALQLMEFILSISEITKHNISDNSKSKILNSALLLYQMQDETGDVPNYGSNDGAHIFPLNSCGYRDYSATINTIYALIDGKRIYPAGDYDEEILWFSDKNIEDIPITQIKKVSSGFNKAGLYSLRHEDGFLMTILQDYKTRPGQMDQLHLDLWHKGRNLFCDCGTYSYASEIGKGLALTAAHNTIKIDDKEQMNKKEPFFIYDWSNAKEIALSEDSFKGTMISKNGYKHTRHIKRVEEGYEINDTVEGDCGCCELHFNTPYEIERTIRGVQLLNNAEVLCTIEARDCEIQIVKSYRSLYYFKKEIISSIVIKAENKKLTSSIKVI